MKKLSVIIAALILSVAMSSKANAQSKQLFDLVNHYRSHYWQFKYEFNDSLCVVAEKYARIISSGKPLMSSNPNICTASGTRLPSYKKCKENKLLSAYHFCKFTDKYFNYCYPVDTMNLLDMYDIISMYVLYTWSYSYFHQQVVMNGCHSMGCYLLLDYANSERTIPTSSMEYPYYHINYIAVMITK